MKYSLEKIYSEPTLDEGLFSFIRSYFQPIATNATIDDNPIVLVFTNTNTSSSTNVSSSQWNIRAEGIINFSLENYTAKEAWFNAVFEQQNRDRGSLRNPQEPRNIQNRQGNNNRNSQPRVSDVQAIKIRINFGNERLNGHPTIKDYNSLKDWIKQKITNSFPMLYHYQNIRTGGNYFPSAGKTENPLNLNNEMFENLAVEFLEKIKRKYNVTENEINADIHDVNP